MAKRKVFKTRRARPEDINVIITKRGGKVVSTVKGEAARQVVRTVQQSQRFQPPEKQTFPTPTPEKPIVVSAPFVKTETGERVTIPEAVAEVRARGGTQREAAERLVQQRQERARVIAQVRIEEEARRTAQIPAQRRFIPGVSLVEPVSRVEGPPVRVGVTAREGIREAVAARERKPVPLVVEPTLQRRGFPKPPIRAPREPIQTFTERQKEFQEFRRGTAKAIVEREELVEEGATQELLRRGFFGRPDVGGRIFGPEGVPLTFGEQVQLGAQAFIETGVTGVESFVIGRDKPFVRRPTTLPGKLITEFGVTGLGVATLPTVIPADIAEQQKAEFIGRPAAAAAAALAGAPVFLPLSKGKFEEAALGTAALAGGFAAGFGIAKGVKIAAKPISKLAQRVSKPIISKVAARVVSKADIDLLGTVKTGTGEVAVGRVKAVEVFKVGRRKGRAVAVGDFQVDILKEPVKLVPKQLRAFRKVGIKEAKFTGEVAARGEVFIIGKKAPEPITFAGRAKILGVDIKRAVGEPLRVGKALIEPISIETGVGAPSPRLQLFKEFGKGRIKATLPSGEIAPGAFRDIFFGKGFAGPGKEFFTLGVAREALFVPGKVPTRVFISRTISKESPTTQLRLFGKARDVLAGRILGRDITVIRDLSKVGGIEPKFPPGFEVRPSRVSAQTIKIPPEISSQRMIGRVKQITVKGASRQVFPGATAAADIARQRAAQVARGEAASLAAKDVARTIRRAAVLPPTAVAGLGALRAPAPMIALPREFVGIREEFMVAPTVSGVARIPEVFAPEVMVTQRRIQSIGQRFLDIQTKRVKSITRIGKIQKPEQLRQPTQLKLPTELMRVENLLREEVIQRQEPLQRIGQIQRTGQLLRTKQLLRQKQIQRVAARAIVKIPIIPVIPPIPVFPLLPPLPGVSRVTKRFAPGFQTFIRRKGKFESFGPILPEAKAFALGKKEVFETPARTFELRPTKTIVRAGRGGIISFKGLRRPRGKTKLPRRAFVEISKIAIKEMGELKGITEKGLKARRTKRRRKSLFDF